MKIQHIKIHNWRSIKEISIPASDLMVMIGQNNHGKSNLLSALLFFFGEIKLQDLDFNHGAQELFVEVTFHKISESDRNKFKKYLTSDSMVIVRKTAQFGGSFNYRGYIQNPNEEYLRESNAQAYTKREIAESLPFHKYLPESGRLSKQHIVDAQNAYMASEGDAISYSFELEPTNFMGLKTVASEIFGKVFFIPAVKEASDEFTAKDASPFGKIYNEMIGLMSEKNKSWSDTKSNLASLFRSLNKYDEDGKENIDRPNELTELEKEITNELSGWNASIDIEIEEPDIDAVFKANTKVWVNDGVRTDIKRKGHGLQRALTMALVNLMANRHKSSDQEDNGDKSPSESIYFIFEEPELYLHPQAQRSLFAALNTLSQDDCQVMLCTHSSMLIDVENYKSIYIVTKDSETTGSKVKQCLDDLFDGDDKKNFNLSYWINPDRGELFFARKVILTEGATEKTVLPKLAQVMGIHKHEYTLIDCGSKTSIPLYMRLLNKFQIQYIVAYDKDHQAGKDADAIACADKATKSITDEIDNTLGSCIEFINDIEEELGMSSSGGKKPYLALNFISEPGFAISEQLKGKLEQIYS